MRCHFAIHFRGAYPTNKIGNMAEVGYIEPELHNTKSTNEEDVCPETCQLGDDSPEDRALTLYIRSCGKRIGPYKIGLSREEYVELFFNKYKSIYSFLTPSSWIALQFGLSMLLAGMYEMLEMQYKEHGRVRKKIAIGLVITGTCLIAIALIFRLYNRYSYMVV